MKHQATKVCRTGSLFCICAHLRLTVKASQNAAAMRALGWCFSYLTCCCCEVCLQALENTVVSLIWTCCESPAALCVHKLQHWIHAWHQHQDSCELLSDCVLLLLLLMALLPSSVELLLQFHLLAPAACQRLHLLTCQHLVHLHGR